MTLFDVPDDAPQNTVVGTAVMSDDGKYRYSLTRKWDSDERPLGWVGLNPSTANADEDDRTVGRMVNFSRRDGYTSLVLVNLASLISTDPAGLLEPGLDYVGPGTQAAYGLLADLDVVIAWGAGVDNFPALKGRADEVIELLDTIGARILCLGRTASGEPRHPLYLKADTPFEPYS